MMNRSFVDTLERRELLAATPTLNKGILYIRGSDAADVITVRESNGVISLVGTTALYPASSVKAIVIDARGGNDHIQLANQFTDPTAALINKPALLVGGEGNDTIGGGFARDVVLGGNGDDVLAGAWGDDLVVGGLGNDSIKGGDGNDNAFGSVGLDTLEGGPGNDRLYGNADNDSLLGEDGNDLLAGGAGIDTLSGGADVNIFSDVNNGFVRIPHATGQDSLTAAVVETTGHALFVRFNGSAIADINSASQRLPQNKAGKAFKKMVGLHLYEGLFSNKRVAKYFGVRS